MVLDRHQCKTNFLDLNDHILYSLFNYFSDSENYFVLNNISTKMKSNKFVVLAGTFILTSLEPCSCEDVNKCAPKVLFVFRWNHKLISISWKQFHANHDGIRNRSLILKPSTSQQTTPFGLIYNKKLMLLSWAHMTNFEEQIICGRLFLRIQ